jgi:putative transposase/transposase-like zinc-binding protein
VGAVPLRTAGAVAPPRLELADLVRAHGNVYRRTHRLATVQHVALRAIAACRTAALGGHRETCDRCGAVRITYNSCRNRHCPKCQTLTKERWLAARKADLLPIPYFHVVFTLPHDLNALAQGNARVLYSLLFRAAADTLLAFARDPRHLGGTIGITAILHTWGQTLTQHLHLHCLVTGGALSVDRTRWIRGHASFLFPVKALSVVFRAKYLAGLRRAFDDGALTFAAGTASLADRRCFAALITHLRATSWVVYAKRPFAGPEQVLEYLGRYTHRVALSNDRLVDLRDGQVRFRWKDYADHDRVKIMTLAADEFLRRFLLHVLPRGFMRMRHFGLLANRRRRVSLPQCRDLLGQLPAADAPVESAAALVYRLTGIDLTCCPACGKGRMLITATLDATPPLDSS